MQSCNWGICCLVTGLYLYASFLENIFRSIFSLVRLSLYSEGQTIWCRNIVDELHGLSYWRDMILPFKYIELSNRKSLLFAPSWASDLSQDFLSKGFSRRLEYCKCLLFNHYWQSQSQNIEDKDKSLIANPKYVALEIQVESYTIERTDK